MDRTNKPFKGEIHNWFILRHPILKDGLGFKIGGKPVGHPTFINWFLSSEVVKWSEDGRIETLNSVYQLVGEEQCIPPAWQSFSSWDLH